MNLLTADELAAELKMSRQVVLRWARAGRIKAELKVGRSPRFDLNAVCRQLKAATKANGMVPTL